MPKFFSRRGLSPTLSWKWPSATLSPSFGLFQSEKPLFRGVPGVPRCASLVRICPRDRLPCRKKKLFGAPYFCMPCEFCDLFRWGIFTQPVWNHILFYSTFCFGASKQSYLLKSVLHRAAFQHSLHHLAAVVGYGIEISECTFAMSTALRCW